MALFPFNFTPPLIDFASVAQGINCRFGARGIISEAHYDGGRNFVAMLRGTTFETMKACVMYTGMYVSSHRIFFFLFASFKHNAGAKRYVLLPPTECKNLYLYERGHPEGEGKRSFCLGWGREGDATSARLIGGAWACRSAHADTVGAKHPFVARHSKADWSQPDYARFPKLKTARYAPKRARATAPLPPSLPPPPGVVGCLLPHIHTEKMPRPQSNAGHCARWRSAVHSQLLVPLHCGHGAQRAGEHAAAGCGLVCCSCHCPAHPLV